MPRWRESIVFFFLLDGGTSQKASLPVIASLRQLMLMIIVVIVGHAFFYGYFGYASSTFFLFSFDLDNINRLTAAVNLV